MQSEIQRPNKLYLETIYWNSICRNNWRPVKTLGGSNSEMENCYFAIG